MAYLVRTGDTLGDIAAQHETTVSTLMRLNPGLSDPNHIQAGQPINLPEPIQRQHCTVGQIQTASSCAPEPFELAFYWNDTVQQRDSIYTEIFGEARNFRQQAIFARANEHLEATVLPGEIVIICNMPHTPEDKRRLSALKEQARLASEGIQQLTHEEATTIKRHLAVFDYVSIEDIASAQGAALGVLSASIKNRLHGLKDVLSRVNSAYLEELTHNPSANRFSQDFYMARQQLFQELDSAANRITMSSINIPQHSRIKHTLGLSTKSILHNASEILDQGQVPQLGQRINTVSAWAKGSNYLGRLGFIIDGSTRINRILDACSAGRSDQCGEVTYMQIGGFATSATAGGISGVAGAKIAVLGATSIALVFGVTLGAPVLAIVALSGAAVGAYTGGSLGSTAGEAAGQKIYEWWSR